MEPITQFLSTPQGVVTAVIVGLLAGNAVFGGAQLKAHMRQDCSDLATKLAKAGFTHLPKILNALATGDLAGALKEIRSVKETFSDPKQFQAELETTFTNILNAKLADPNEATRLQDIVTKAAAAFAAGTPGAAVPGIAASMAAGVAGGPVFASFSNLLHDSAPGTLLANELQKLGRTDLLGLLNGTVQNVSNKVWDQVTKSSNPSVAMTPTSPTSQSQAATPVLPDGHILLGPGATLPTPASVTSPDPGQPAAKTTTAA